MVADWVGKNLYKAGFVQAVVNADAAMGNTMLRAVDRLRLALGNKKSRSKTNLAVVERLFMRALEQEQVTHEGGAEYSIEYLREKPNGDIIDLLRKVESGEYKQNDKVILGTVDSATSEKIRQITGIDVSGWKVAIEARQLKHILNRHGKNGAADNSMADEADIAKMEYALHNAEHIVDGGTSHAYTNFVNGKDRPAKTVLYQKDIGGIYYYVVQAVPDTKRRTLFVDSAFINKTKKVEDLYSANAQSPDETPESASTATSTNTKIPQNGSGVNTYSMQDGENNSQKSIVNRPWLQGDTSVDMYGNPVEAPVSQSTATETVDSAPAAQPTEAPSAPPPVSAATAPDNGRQGGTYDAEALERATDVDGVLDALGDEEAYRRLQWAAQMDRPEGSVELDGLEMSCIEYGRRVYEALPSDPNALRAAQTQTRRALQNELTRLHQQGETTSSTALRLNIQLFAQKAKLDYVLDPGEDGKKARQFYEKRLRGTDANHSEELVEMLKGHDETYNPIANKKTLDKAKEKLRNLDYQKDLLRRITRNNPRDMLNATEVAAAQVMINDAINDGDLQRAMDMITGLSRKGTDLGRAVQAFSMQARLTPEGTLRAATKVLRKEADRIIGTGANEELDTTAGVIADTIERADDAARKRAEGSTVPVDLSGATRQQVRDALVDDLAGTEGTYLTKKEIADIVDKLIEDSTNIPAQIRRYITKKQGKGALAERIYEVYKKGHLNDNTMRQALEEALGLPSLTEAEVSRVVELATEIAGLDEDPVKQAEVMDTLYDMLGEKLHVSKLEALQAWRKFAMLANPKTHIRNVVSNGVYFGVRKADEAVAQLLEHMLLKDPAQGMMRLGWNHTPEGQALMPILERAADEAMLQMQRRGKKYEAGSGVLDSHRKYFRWEWLNNLNDFNSRWLEREDLKFSRPAFIDALGQVMVNRGLTEVTPEAQAIAMQRAEEATFRADNAINEVLKALKRFSRSDKAGLRLFGQAMDVVIPFAKTPANIAVQSFYHSPLGLAKGGFEFYQATKNKDGQAAAQAINTLSKGLTGTALLGIGVLLGTLGLFNTGFGKTEKERAADELAGIQENALVLGDVSISLDWLQPAASPFIVGASIAQRLKEDGISLSSVFGAVMDGTDSLFELTMLQSLYDVLGGYDAGASASAASVAENVISQSLPTLLGQLARATDPVQRKTTGDNGFETIVNQIMAKIPVLTYLLEPELDVWGNEVYRTGKAGGGAAALNVLQQFVSPANVKIGTGTGDATSAEILRLYGDGLPDGASGAIPTAISRDDAANHKLDYTDSNRALGRMNRQAVIEFINDEWPYTVTVEENGRRRKVTKFYSDMTDEERRKVLSRLYTKAKKQFTDPEEAADDRYFSALMKEMEQ